MFKFLKILFRGKKNCAEVHSSESKFLSILKPRSEQQAKSYHLKGAFHSASLSFRQFRDLPDEEYYQILAGRNLLSAKKAAPQK